MHVMDMFRNFLPQQPSLPQNPAAPGAPTMPAPTGVQNPNQPLPGTAGGANTPPNIVPGDPSNPTGAPQTPEDPLSGLKPFADIWAPVKVDPNNPDPNPYPFANLDPAKVMESASKLDFSKAVTPELMAQVAAGGQEAVAALASIVNNLGRNVSGQQIIATNKMLETALEAQRKAFEAQIPSLVRQHAVKDALATQHPAMSDPALEPMVAALRTQYINKNPTATAAQISGAINDYFNTVGKVFAPKVEPTPAQKAAAAKAAQEFDFTKFLGS